MKVVVLTTSYPRDADDVAGRFIADSVEGVRELAKRLPAFVRPLLRSARSVVAASTFLADYLFLEAPAQGVPSMNRSTRVPAVGR